MIVMLNKIRSVMFGHAVGDALGVPVEFRGREYLDRNPVTDMIGFGTYNLPAGCWSDDTSMSLCSLESLSKGVVDYDDIMKNFGKWYYRNEFTPEGFVFDIGNTSGHAIDNYFYGKMSATSCGLSSIRSNGNGSLMRIHPFVLYAYYSKIKDEDEFIGMISAASSLTHAHSCSIDGCIIYAYVLKELLSNPIKDSIYIGLQKAKHQMTSSVPYYGRLLNNDISLLNANNIKSSGYVVDSLEAAIWCLLTTETYKECVLKAVNLGEDTDTIAAIAGGLAGALYGFESISSKWINTLKRKNYIDDMCVAAYERWRGDGM
jgi:ADP-ribosylglycohydrolase